MQQLFLETHENLREYNYMHIDLPTNALRKHS